MTTSPPPGHRSETTGVGPQAPMAHWHWSCQAGHRGVQPTPLFWVLAQSGGGFLTELVGNQTEHLESGPVLKPAAFTQLDVSWVTREHLQSVFHFTVRRFFRSRAVSFQLVPSTWCLNRPAWGNMCHRIPTTIISQAQFPPRSRQFSLGLH